MKKYMTNLILVGTCDRSGCCAGGRAGLCEESACRRTRRATIG